MRGHADRLLIRATGLDRLRLAAVVAAALVATAAGLFLPGALAAAVDAVVAGRPSGREVSSLLLAGGAEIAADVVGGILTTRVTATASAWLRRTVFGKLLALGTRSHFAEGDAISRLTGDCTGAGGIVTIIIQCGSTLVISSGAVALLALLDWRLALVFLGSIPFALLLARSHLRRTADDVLTYQRVSGEIAARMVDAVAGLRTIAASGTAEREAERVLRPLPKLTLAGRGLWRTQARMVWRAGLLTPAVELSVLAAAGFGVLEGRLSVGDVVATLGYVALGLGLVTQIPLLTMLSRARGCAERLAEVLDRPEPMPGKLPLLPGDGTVELRHVGITGALTEVDLCVDGGTFVAVVGRSGAGKSALAGVLGGLITPDEGQVLLDGRPLDQIRPEELRAAFGYAFERPALLGATVVEAVGYGSWAGESAVRSACRTAQVDEVVVRLPEGYRTPLTETPLSGGEAQRLGLARAIVRNPRVLIFDDATASLDTVTEAAVERAVAGAMPGRTRVVVTHRVSTAARADLVVWLEDGRIRAVAPHTALWQEPGFRGVFTEDDQ
ncbi:ABC transporter ATP-binding protein [Amycolatopsis balhimycina DSM 5908]|uniref:ABC transporter ATP-binding protein n=1 Tax=Amycolatopsis balhimycina DSM 5908 TaxID=1081091 RepID=A0A428W7N6_AMYBA|nr:ABC transporter ATP-binding protein [Amycolatopsis balhimycina]RSM39142.1 ABC transporter ATP-binding protein [Amycolatopsis balhimycina DSM 5908]